MLKCCLKEQLLFLTDCSYGFYVICTAYTDKLLLPVWLWQILCYLYLYIAMEFYIIYTHIGVSKLIQLPTRTCSYMHSTILSEHWTRLCQSTRSYYAAMLLGWVWRFQCWVRSWQDTLHTLHNRGECNVTLEKCGKGKKMEKEEGHNSRKSYVCYVHGI